MHDIAAGIVFAVFIMAAARIALFILEALLIGCTELIEWNAHRRTQKAGH